MFKGQIRNTIEGISETCTSSTSADFYSFGLESKGRDNVEASFIHFLESKIFRGDNQYSIGDRRIDTRTFRRIEKAPAVFVLHLKWFDYNLETLARGKINNRFEFPPLSDFSDFIVGGHHANYRLTGIVLQSGTASGGYYSSLVKGETKWSQFNDMEVSEMAEALFFQRVYE
jgi:ubiquitin C-terminal hydrolase